MNTVVEITQDYMTTEAGFDQKRWDNFATRIGSYLQLIPPLPRRSGAR